MKNKDHMMKPEEMLKMMGLGKMPKDMPKKDMPKHKGSSRKK